MDIYFRECPAGCGAQQRVEIHVAFGGELVDRPVPCACEKQGRPSVVLELERRRMGVTERAKKQKVAAAEIRALTERVLAAHPDWTSAALWHEMTKHQPVHVKQTSWANTYLVEARKKLKANGTNGARPPATSELRNPKPEAAPAPVAPAVTAPPPRGVTGARGRASRRKAASQEVGSPERTGDQVRLDLLPGDPGLRRRVGVRDGRHRAA